MIRLVIQSQQPEEAVLEVHGRLSGKHVAILQHEGTRLLEESKNLVLDLKGVRFIDEAGIALLQRWCGKGATLRGGSWFVRTLLEDRGLIPEEAGDPSA